VIKTEINGLECNTPALETLKRNPQANSTNLTDQIVGIALSKCSPRDGLGQEIRPSYAILQSNHDILGLWKLIAHIHTKGKGGSILQIRNAVPEGSEEHGVKVPRVRRRPPITGGPEGVAFATARKILESWGDPYHLEGQGHAVAKATPSGPLVIGGRRDGYRENL
jgi:hypothetical protein